MHPASHSVLRQAVSGTIDTMRPKDGGARRKSRPSPRQRARAATTSTNSEKRRRQRDRRRKAERKKGTSSSAVDAKASPEASSTVHNGSRSSGSRAPPSPPAPAASSPSGETELPMDVRLKELLWSITPTDGDRRDMLQVLRDLKRCLSRLGLDITPYGSLVTGLLIPTSDIDCVMLPAAAPPKDASGGAAVRVSPALARVVETLQRPISCSTDRQRKALFSSGVRVIATAVRSDGAFGRIQPICHAKVPIVKCEHRDRNRKVDLSFEQDGCASSRFLCDAFATPGNEMARPLTILVKALIANAHLDDPSMGGLGSFATSMMVLWYLREKVPAYPEQLKNSIAVLLSGFLKYYGTEFNHCTKGINYVKGATFSKPASTDLYIMNPLKPQVNCAKAASAYTARVQPLFKEAAGVLSKLLDLETDGYRVEAALDRFYHEVVPHTGDWRQLRRRAQSGRGEAPDKWDKGTGLYIGGVI